jgi:ribosome-associated protein
MPPAKGPGKPAAPAVVPVRLPITLGQFLKVSLLVSSGGEAKTRIASGEVRVNGEVDERRGHKLVPGDVVEVAGVSARVALAPGGEPPTVGVSDGPAPAGRAAGSAFRTPRP